LKLLIAEDEEAAREQIASMVKVWGYEPVFAPDGNEAIRIMTGEDPPLLAILNWKLSGASGADVCREIRLTRMYPYTYIIVLLPKTEKDTPLDCLEAGADDCLPRPAQANELRARLRVAGRFLASQQKLLTVTSEAQYQATRDATTGLWNRASILKFVDQYLSRCSKADDPLFLLLLKIDGLEEVNQRFGSATGDNILREAAERLRTMFQTYDHIGRYHGVKFLIIEPNSPRQKVEMLKGKLDQCIREKEFMVPGGTVKLTAKVSLVETEQRYESSKSLLLRLDRSLADPPPGAAAALGSAPHPDSTPHPQTAAESAAAASSLPRKNAVAPGASRSF